MPKVTRIKASDGPQKKAKKESRDAPASEQKDKLNKKVVQSESSKNSKKSKNAKKSGKKPFVLFRPFVALGHYIRDSWRELRQVRWPNRKMTWQMLLAVVLYSALFMAIISLLDLAFSGMSNLILNR